MTDSFYDEANDFGKDEPYFDLTNHRLVPLITEGLIEGINAFRRLVEDDGLEESEVFIDVDADSSSLIFSYGEDEEEFFTFKLGPVLNRSLELLEAMENYSYRHALSNWFEDAVPDIPEEAYEGLNISLDVPEVGGDPYLENYV